MATTFDRDEYELRWPPQLFIDEANRLRRYTTSQVDEILGVDRIGWTSEMEWLLTEAFASTVPTETMKRVLRGGVQWGGPNLRGAEQWISQLLGEVANFPGPDTRKPYWSARTTARPAPTRLRFTDVTRHFVRLIEEFEANGYLVNAFGQKCVDDQGPRPDPSAVLERRLGYDIFGWPLEFSRPGWEVDDFYDLVEVLHDLVARPSRRWYHDKSGCGWHYGGFATRPARRLYRWQVNRLLAGSDLGLRLAEEGEDLGRLVRMEPTGLEDLPEEALQTARPETVDRVQHAIALFRSRKATVEERRSAVIALVGILQERRDLLKAELLSKDEDALFYVANKFAIRHQGADQRSDYDDVYLDWLFGGISPPSISPTSCLLARRSHSRAVGHRSHLPDRQDFHLDRPLRGPLSVMVMVLTESLRRAAPMPYKQAAEQRQELPSRSIPRRRRPEFVPSRSMPRRRRPEFVPAGRVHAIDTDTREVACGINAAGLYVFDRDWASGIGMDWCPACVEATGYGRPPDA